MLSERQEKAVLKLFVNAFSSADGNKRRDVYMDFVESFLGNIKHWENAIYGTFREAEISLDIIKYWQELEEERRGYCTETICEIGKMTMADESQIVKLILKEIGGRPHFAEFNEIGTVKDFETTGYSYVAKMNNEVVGVIMAQRIMDYGSWYIYI